MPATPHATRDDIRELEARFDARFQAVSARFVRVDNRFANVDGRLDEIDRRHGSLAQQINTRFQMVDARLDTTHARIDELRSQVGGVERETTQLGTKVDRLGHMMVLGFLASGALTASLWASTVTVIA